MNEQDTFDQLKYRTIVHQGHLYYINSLDQMHREDGPAVLWKNGGQCWYINNQLHREDGPAVEYQNGDRCWYFNDKLHREDGPAIEYSSGNSNRWYINGIELTEDEFNAKIIYG